MKIHLAWIRVTAAAALVTGVGAYPAVAQYPPYQPIPPQPVAPQATAPVPAAPQYVAYRTQPAYQQTAAPYQAPATAQYSQYPQYPQTAATQYPAAYGYRVAQATPTEAIPAPQQPAAPGPGNGNGAAMPSASAAIEPMPGAGAAPAAQGMPAGNGFAAGCGCAGGGAAYGAAGYSAAGYGTAGCSSGSYPEISNYFGGESCSENQWFGGVYFLEMARTKPSDIQLTVQVQQPVVSNYYPPKSKDIISTDDVNVDFRAGIEARIGSTFTIGDSCGSNGGGYGYNGCGCNSCGSCNTTTYAWEVAWWGLEDDQQDFMRSDDITSPNRIYGMKNFSGLEYDRDGSGGNYMPRPVNYYYGYNLPIEVMPSPLPSPPPNMGDGGNYVAVVAQRVYTDFKVQNLELNIIRFPACEVCSGGSNSGCGCNACGCEGGCGCQAPKSCFSMYGSCGVRYFRIDDDFSFDSQAAEWVPTAGGVPGHFDNSMPDGFSNDNSLCYDVNVDNNLIGPQVGWTTNYSCGCRWNFFCNSTMGVFDNEMDQMTRMWSPGGGTITLPDGSDFNIHSHKNDIAFLGELRVGCSYDISCNWRAVAAYRAVAMTGIATSEGQIPDNFSSRAEITQINSDNSLVVHGVQTGIECRY